MAYVGNSPTQQSFTGGVDQYNGNNSNTVFGLTRTINTVYDVDAYVENVWQRPATGYTVSANVITFTSAPPAGSNNVVVVYRNFSATSIVPQQGSVVASSFAANAIPSALGYTPANKAGDTFSGAVSGITTLAAGNTTITGTLTATANVNIDAGTLFVDGTNNRVGINNTAPTSALTVTGNAAFSSTVAVAGVTTLSANVILGTTTITANGGVGTSGQVLTSGATGNAYWSTVATTLDSVLASGNTTTKALTTGALTVNGAMSTTSTTANSANYSLVKSDSGTGNQNGQLINFYNYGPSGTARNAGTNIGGLYFGASQPTSGAIQDAAGINCIAETQTGTNTASALAFLTNTGNAGNIERLRINSSGYSNFKTKRVGLGTYTGEGREQQLISYTGTATNGTITLLSETGFGENGHCGMFFLNVMQAGKGVSRIYFLTGRYGECTLTMYQGGNRSAGEDAYLQLLGGTNTIGLRLVISGFSGSVPYFVNGWIGITSTNDIWFSN